MYVQVLALFMFTVPLIPTQGDENMVAIRRLQSVGASVDQIDNDQDGHGFAVDFNKVVNDRDLLPLAKLKPLVGLRILQGEITDAGLKSLESCTELRTLVLNSARITDRGMASIPKMKSIVKLDLMKMRLTTKGLIELRKLPDLRRLYLFGAHVNEKDLGSLYALSNLSVLYLSETVSDAALARLKQRLQKTDVRRI